MSEELEIPTELLEKDPLELAESQQDIDRIIEYLQRTRENIRAAEKSGKRITGKAARTKAQPVTEGSILDVLVKDV
jgi:hypothetical protein|tara:strand:+ start:1203 stop:1430 length:228 start_codon:yes stop_codon:yes gene_type:complete